MNERWWTENYYKYSVAIILILLIILLLYYTSPFFAPILWFIAAVFIPILLSTFLYYILRPFVNVLEKWLPRYLAILITYFVLALVITLVFLIVTPEIVNTFKNIPTEKLESINLNKEIFFDKLKEYIPFATTPLMEDFFFSYLPIIYNYIYQLSLNLVSTLASLTISLALTPFVLFYFLRDAGLLSRFVMRFTPTKFRDEVQKILDDVDSTLSEFIIAQVTIAAIVGFFLFCGYVVIGLTHPLTLALFAMIFYVIPFLGTFIAIIPALIVALSISFEMTIKVILVMFLAHFLEANLITPRMMSIRLKIHPLTVILLLLAAGSLYGILGLLLVTPTYAILKVVVWNIYKIIRLHTVIAKSQASAQEANETPHLQEP